MEVPLNPLEELIAMPQAERDKAIDGLKAGRGADELAALLQNPLHKGKPANPCPRSALFNPVAEKVYPKASTDAAAFEGFWDWLLTKVAAARMFSNGEDSECLLYTAKEAYKSEIFRGECYGESWFMAAIKAALRWHCETHNKKEEANDG